VWIVKTHFPERFGYKRYKVKKIILLIRNPFDTLDSYFNMVQRHTPPPPPTLPFPLCCLVRSPTCDVRVHVCVCAARCRC
jgi:hypothetical protein